MALATYQNRYREKQQELWNQGRDSGNDFGDKIDIS
jgi:hypothetical protein